jgi:flagellar biosynthesis protein FlhF
MQVKKFEARTMKEALTMIKNQLGPEAIILSAKEINKSFGIGGKTSVEITAAVSDLTLRKKQLAEKKLNENDKRRFQQISAEKQKEFINKVFTKTQSENQPPPQITKTRYIDIDNEADNLREEEAIAQKRIKSAAAEALRAASGVVETTRPSQKNQMDIIERQRFLAMQAEINHLRGVIAEFQKMPQSFITSHPGANEGISYELSTAFKKMRKIGIEKDIVIKILKLAQRALSSDQLKKPAYIDAWVARYILENTLICDTQADKKYHLFVGPTGQGKTASLVKMASHLVICKKKNIVIATCDNQKVGAVEQLKIYAKILNVPFVLIKKPEDWNKLEQVLPNVDHILVDYPGMSLRNEIEKNYLMSMIPKELDKGRSIHYVQSSLAKNIDAIEMLKNYREISPTDLIITNLDMSTHHGMIVNLQQKFALPLHSFGIGSHIPEDFEMATKERVVDLLFKLSKIRSSNSHQIYNSDNHRLQGKR